MHGSNGNNYGDDDDSSDDESIDDVDTMSM